MITEQIQQLIEENNRLKSQLKFKEEELERKEEELDRKNERILYLERQLYGRRSEKQLPSYSQAQLSLFDEKQGEGMAEEEAILFTLTEEITRKAEQRRAAKKDKAPIHRTYKIPADIERREVILNPENLTGDMIKIGEDVSERLMLEPSKFWVERIVRPIYKKKGDKETLSTVIHQAPLTKTILPGCQSGASLLSQIIVDKFLYHIPEHRQAKRFKDLGVEITTSSINRWVHALADKLYPLYISQMQKVLSSDYVQIDETTLPVTNRQGKARKAYLWAVRSPLVPGLFFHYEKGSRSQEVLVKMLKDFQGALQSDGYAAYSIFEDKPGVLPLGCMAHVRRKFESALATFPQAQKALDYIALLYMLEGNLKAEAADYEQIRQEREEKAYPILQQMESWMKETCNNSTPDSLLGKAIRYAFGMWPRICRYCKDGRFMIDNNGIENAIRPIAIGRKNYLFSGNDNGAEDNCLFYTLIGSCLQENVNPQLWLNAVLNKIPQLQNPIDWTMLFPCNFSELQKSI